MSSDLSAPKRPNQNPKQKKASSGDRDPLLWLIVVVSLGVFGAYGVGKFMQYRDAQQPLRAADGSPLPSAMQAQQQELSPELRGTDRPGGMEAGSFTTIDPTEDQSIRSAAPPTTTATGRDRTLSEDCAELLQEQRSIEARLRRPIGAQQAEQFQAQIEEISTAMQRAGC